MKILVCCDKGANRSVTLGHLLKFSGHDVLTAGLETNEAETLRMLIDWADKTIVTAKDQPSKLRAIHGCVPLNMELWNMGPDEYRRPFNPTMLRIAQGLVKQKRHQLENIPKHLNGRFGLTESDAAGGVNWLEKKLCRRFAGRAVTRSEIRKVVGNDVSKATIDSALAHLGANGEAFRVSVESDGRGRPPEVWRFLPRLSEPEAIDGQTANKRAKGVRFVGWDAEDLALAMGQAVGTQASERFRKILKGHEGG